MNKIEVAILDFEQSAPARMMLGLAARISKRGHEIHKAQDLVDLEMLKSLDDEHTKRLVSAPHPQLQRFQYIQVVFVGVSRRFMAQITRSHGLEFMCSSQRQADHGPSHAGFMTPLEILRLGEPAVDRYKEDMDAAYGSYCDCVEEVGREAANYLMPQSLRTTILASGTMGVWKDVISSRVCGKCSPEMRYTMLLLWDLLYKVDPILFSTKTTGPRCWRSSCTEAKPCSKMELMFVRQSNSPGDLLAADFPDLSIGHEDTATKYDAP